ncbi:MAG TPA: bifunctional DNA-formamidopyrimidine glycosylase/DNA-(apurinic or apyrimidinic site) lyase [Anaerolineae bacterium]|nr:bifunctional DNA-formamidopyrimidine glycosylase/DNA-(apurinic or apyrimidinic site) lyase [Anaerolineae bacterium]
MPEMPEVETIVRALKRRIVGETIVDALVEWPGSIARLSPAEFSQRIVGRRVAAATRSGKFTIIRLAPPKLLVVHLGMTGRLSVDEASEANAPTSASQDAHTRVVIRFVSRKALRFRDMRKFGRIYLVDDACEIPLLRDLGPEALSDTFKPRMLRELLRRHRRQIKPLLLDQHVLAGLGNIYVDESLWQARIHPRTLSHVLSTEEANRLYRAIRKVLRQAIRNRGTTIRDYRDLQGEPGENQGVLSVYRLQGEQCRRCGHVICRTMVAGRSTHYCPTCQPLGSTEYAMTSDC